MIDGNINNSPVRSVKGKVELYEGSTLLDTYTYRDRLKSFTIERAGEDSKFFGFGICQKINIKLIDKDRELDITTAYSFKVYLTTGEEEDYVCPYPEFHVTETHRDENTNELSITAYDQLYWASSTDYFLGESKLTKMNHFARRASLLLGLPLERVDISPDNSGTAFIDDVIITTPNIPTSDNYYTLNYPDGPSLSGTETVKDIFDDIAEAIQAVYYLDGKSHLVFKRLDRDGDAALTISKSDYITLDSKTNRRLTTIFSTTELGDNVNTPEAETNDLSVTTGEIGTTQYIKSNIMIDLRDDRAAILDTAIAAIGGLTINQFDCSWRGNYLLELGDKMALITKDDKTVYSYLLNDVVEYNGSLSQKSKWQCANGEESVFSNPTTLGDALKQTYAKVDKANQRIELAIESVADLEKTTSDSITELTNQVSLTMTTETIEAKFASMKTEGVEQVVTSEKKFSFSDEGLDIADSNSKITTHIDEDGMTISRDGEEVLIANNEGVKAEDLHATTYLIIGKNSRFEDYEASDGSSRTGCFWIGG